MLGVDVREQTATVLGYLGNSQYNVETENKNRYLRYLDTDGNEIGVDKIKALLMQATDAELEICKDFIESQLNMLH